MNMLVATSRGGGLDALTKEGITLKGYVYPGATLLKLDMAMEGNVEPKQRRWFPPEIIFPPPHIAKSLDIHTYILAGSNDITTLAKDYTHNYRECIYTGTIANTITDIKRDLAVCADTIRKKQATPIFCTITPFNIALYNQSLLEANSTYTLKHKHEYETWQKQIDEIVNKVNDHIIETNTLNSLATPMCHRCIIKHHGTKTRGYKRTNWKFLKDGLHGDKKFRKAWAQSISAAILINRKLPRLPKRGRSSSSTSDEPGSPKRSWKSEKRPTALP